MTSLYGGGAERVCCLLASELAETCDVFVAYLNETELSYPLDERCRTILIPNKNYRRWNVFYPLMKLFHAVSFCRKLKKENRIDAAVSFLLSMNTVNVLSHDRERVICSERCNPKKWEPEKFPLTRYLYWRADHVVFQTERVKNLYGRYVRGHSSVIRNPVGLTLRADRERSRRIVTMGRLVEQKNHAMLIRAFAGLDCIVPGYTLWIYGEGELLPQLRALAQEQGVEEKVFFPGNRPDVHEQIQDVRMFVLSSRFEGLSNSLLECMRMGIACISTDCEGSDEVLRDGENGLLVPVGDEQALTKAMIRLADDDDLCAKLGAQAMIDSQAFRTERIIGQWKKVLFESASTAQKTE